MKRITVSFPDQLAERIDKERRRQDVSGAEVVRQALEAHFARKGQITSREEAAAGVASATDGESAGGREQDSTT